MKIHHNVISSLPKLYTQNQDNNQMNNQLKMETGPALPGHDSVEISEAKYIADNYFTGEEADFCPRE